MVIEQTNIVQILSDLLVLVYSKYEQNDLYFDLQKSILTMFVQFTTVSNQYIASEVLTKCLEVLGSVLVYVGGQYLTKWQNYQLLKTMQ